MATTKKAMRKRPSQKSQKPKPEPMPPITDGTIAEVLEAWRAVRHAADSVEALAPKFHYPSLLPDDGRGSPLSVLRAWNDAYDALADCANTKMWTLLEELATQRALETGQ